MPLIPRSAATDERLASLPMKTKPKKWLVRGALILGLLVLVGYGFRDIWLRQFRAYFLGLVEIRAEESGFRLPDVDEIEVIALAGPTSDSTPQGDSILGYRVHAHATLRGDESAKVAELWRSLRRGREFSGMCHDPGYALRFHHNGKLVFETTVCWACHNFTLPIGILGRFEYGFDAESTDSKALLELLQSHAPQPK